jgi:mannose-6-phosphate isomerase-like protein (cupin superfamily)
VGYTVANRDQATDWMAQFPGFGEMRWYTEALGCAQVSFSWRSMPAGTGGRGSYGHRHPGIEEIYLVLSGTATFKIDDDVLELGPLSAVKVEGDSYRSVHNDTGDEVQLVAISVRSDGETERRENFWD